MSFSLRCVVDRLSKYALMCTEKKENNHKWFRCKLLERSRKCRWYLRDRERADLCHHTLNIWRLYLQVCARHPACSRPVWSFTVGFVGGAVETGHLLYIPLARISRRMMLASLKLKSEVDVSELIVRPERRYSPSTYRSRCWGLGGVEYAKQLPGRGALKISTTAPGECCTGLLPLITDSQPSLRLLNRWLFAFANYRGD